ncbi:VOC family protein [Almyronema epifaneia]|uniref:VOC family protein n=1 Tax=Almyronema epifaneia S1 TaxID=2991925 RepID=A0ABW6IGM1_9CYAN
MSDRFQQHGAFSWYELTTSDASAAKQFYQTLFGWQVKDGPINGMDYSVFSLQGQDMGGIMPVPPDAPSGFAPQWGVYITVNDVDATAKQAAELGGKVCLEPMNIPDVGRFAMIQDPQGATLSIISYNSPAAS